MARLATQAFDLLAHPAVWDSAKWRPLMVRNQGTWVPQSLADVAWQECGLVIQAGKQQHSPIEDADASRQIFLKRIQVKRSSGMVLALVYLHKAPGQALRLDACALLAL